MSLSNMPEAISYILFEEASYPQKGRLEIMYIII